MEILGYIFVFIFLYLFLTRKQRRSKAFLNIIQNMVNNEIEELYFHNIPFDTALQYAYKNGAERDINVEKGYENCIGYRAYILGEEYRIYFTRLHDNGTLIAVRNCNEDMKQVIARENSVKTKKQSQDN